jgi:hypothetical protein
VPFLAQGDTPLPGTIAGHVRLTKIRGAALPATAYAPRAVAPAAPAPYPEIRNVVVYLKNVAYKGRLPVMRRDIVQKGETFVPRVLAITRGSSVGFPNDDPIFHNVFSLSSAATFNLGRYPQGQTRVREFTKPGLVKVYCEIHSQMSASILVLDHPYFAVPTDEGTFELANVPAGSYTVVGWHERVGERTSRIEVRSGQTTSVELSLPVEDDE